MELDLTKIEFIEVGNDSGSKRIYFNRQPLMDKINDTYSKSKEPFKIKTTKDESKHNV